MKKYLPTHIYKLMLATAKSYPKMSGTDGLEGVRKAVKNAMNDLPDDYARFFIKKNLFEGIPMSKINLPLSERTMKRLRKRFLLKLYENLKDGTF